GDCTRANESAGDTEILPRRAFPTRLPFRSAQAPNARRSVFTPFDNEVLKQGIAVARYFTEKLRANCAHLTVPFDVPTDFEKVSQRTRIRREHNLGLGRIWQDAPCGRANRSQRLFRQALPSSVCLLPKNRQDRTVR